MSLYNQFPREHVSSTNSDDSFEKKFPQPCFDRFFFPLFKQVVAFVFSQEQVFSGGGDVVIEATLIAPVLAEVMSGNSVVGCLLSVYFLLVYFLLTGKFPPGLSSASISAMYLSKSSVFDLVGIR